MGMVMYTLLVVVRRKYSINLADRLEPSVKHACPGCWILIFSLFKINYITP